MQMLHSYRLLVTWQALRKKNYLPLMLAVQTLFTLGIVLGYPLLFPTLDRAAIYLIATGAGPSCTIGAASRRARASPTGCSANCAGRR